MGNVCQRTRNVTIQDGSSLVVRVPRKGPVRQLLLRVRVACRYITVVSEVRNSFWMRECLCTAAGVCGARSHSEDDRISRFTHWLIHVLCPWVVRIHIAHLSWHEAVSLVTPRNACVVQDTVRPGLRMSTLHRHRLGSLTAPATVTRTDTA